MNRAIAYSVVPMLLALPSAQASSAAPAKTQVRHTFVAASGSAAPAGGTYLRFFVARLNARNQVAFDAILGGPSGPSASGVFVGDGRRTSTVALRTLDPTAENFGFVNNPFITPHGRVVFDLNQSDTFRSERGTAIPLVRNGDPAPGGGTLSPRTNQHVANARGAIAYLADVLGATATEGIFRADGVDTVAIARDDDIPPTGGTFEFFSEPALNKRGQVAFLAAMTGGTADFGIFRGDGGDLTPVFVANQIAPGGATFLDFGAPRINKHGLLVGAALLTETNGAVTNGLFVGDGTDAVAIALEGQPAPKGGNYSGGFAQPLTINDRGEVAFNVGLTGGTSTRGIFRGDGSHTTTVALEGTIAPGTTGTFQVFHDMKLGNDGRVAFIGRLTPGVGGVDLSNDVGIWVGRSDADLRLLVRTGEVIGGRVLTSLPSFGQLDMNENGVVWIGGFPSGATAVVFSRMHGEDEDDHDRDGNGPPFSGGAPREMSNPGGGR